MQLDSDKVKIKSRAESLLRDLLTKLYLQLSGAKWQQNDVLSIHFIENNTYVKFREINDSFVDKFLLPISTAKNAYQIMNTDRVFNSLKSDVYKLLSQLNVK